MTKEQEPNYLKMAVDSMVDDEVEGPRVILGPTALKNLVNRVRNAALEEAAQTCENRPLGTAYDNGRSCSIAIRSKKEISS